MGVVRKPLFKPPVVSAKDLNAVADMAFGSVQFAGADSETGYGNIFIDPGVPNPNLMVKVFLVSGGSGSDSLGSTTFTSGGSGSDGPAIGAGRCDSKVNRYAFIEHYYDKCGQYVEVEDGFTGDGFFGVAYERNNRLVEDGTIQKITFKSQWIDDSISPSKIVYEWEFNAGGDAGAGLKNCNPEEGQTSGSGNDCVCGIPIGDMIKCVEDGTAIRDACLDIFNGKLVLRSKDGKILSGG